MRNAIRAVFCIILFCTINSGVVADARSALNEQTGSTAPRTDDYEITLVTFSPYDNLFEWFGHSAIEVKHLGTGKAHMFNFGGFYLDLENVWQFVFGRFLYWSFVSESSQALTYYQNQNRHMVFQTLGLTRQQNSEIRRLLTHYQRPQNRYYRYDFFRDNCSTKIRDIIDQALAGGLKEQSSFPAELTYREYVHRMTAGVPYLDFVLMFILGDSADQPIAHWDSMFLPDRLMAVIQASNNPELEGSSSGFPLVEEQSEKNIGPGIPYFASPASAANTVFREFVWGLFLLAIMGLSALFYVKKNRVFRKLYPGLISLFGLVFGTLGFCLFFMMCFTDHKDSFWNENILLLNPITFLLFPVGCAAVFGKLKSIFAWLQLLAGISAIGAVFLKILPMFDQANGQALRVVLPAILVIGITGLIDIKDTHHQPLANSNISL